MSQFERANEVSKKSLVVLVPFLGLLSDAIAHVYAFVFFFIQTPFFAIFIVIPLVGALAALRGGKAGYIVSDNYQFAVFLDRRALLWRNGNSKLGFRNRI